MSEFSKISHDFFGFFSAIQCSEETLLSHIQNIRINYCCPQLNVAVRFLGCEGQEGGDPEGDARRRGLGGDPEGNPAHNDDKDTGDVGGEEEIARVPFQLKHSRQAGEGSSRVVDGAVLCSAVFYL